MLKRNKHFRKSGKPIFVKKPNNKVIVTNNEIASMYSTIENKYVVNKVDFVEQMDETESITAQNGKYSNQNNNTKYN